MSVHEKRKDFTCEFCGKHFVTQRRCNGHVTKTHTQKVECDICKKTLSNSRQLQRHKVAIHNITENVWICDVCPSGVYSYTVISSKTGFEKHIQSDNHVKNSKWCLYFLFAYDDTAQNICRYHKKSNV